MPTKGYALRNGGSAWQTPARAAAEVGLLDGDGVHRAAMAGGPTTVAARPGLLAPLPPPPWPAVHFIGVGGHGLSGLAAALATLGVAVSGSDVAASERTRRLAARGVAVRLGHDGEAVRRLPTGTVAVFSTDVPADNPELAAARQSGHALVHRSALLDWFLRGGHRGAGTSCGVAVTGTHGKTTTAALTGLALDAAGLDPTVFVGADVPGLEGGNFRLGRGEAVVAEADESDGTFVRYAPAVAVVTSLEPEHLEHWGGDFRRVRSAFADWLGGLPTGARVVLCADDPEVQALGATLPADRVLWYGLTPAAARGVSVQDVELGAESAFTAVAGGRVVGRFRLRIPGRHNVANGLGAIAAALALGADPERLGPALAAFPGAGRRFEVLARTGGITVIDDYAHNPTKVSATLAAARLLRPARLVAVFQPHRYQRTQQLWEGFTKAFGAADLVLVTDVYAPPGERRIPGVGGEPLAAAVARGSGVPARYVGAPAAAVALCLAMAGSGDLFLFMGAGDVTLAAHALAARLGPAPAGTGPDTGAGG